jgi:cell division septation protein DedD
VGFIARQQLDQWASEVELEAGKGVARRGRRWSVRLARADNQNDALRVYDELRTAAYAAEILPAKDGDKRVYVVRIRSLPSKAEAQALADRLRGKFGIDKSDVLR